MGKLLLVITMLTERLLDIRKDAELKQEEMAQILKTTQPNYSKWENGTEFIPLRKLNLLCNYFNVSMDYVIGKTRKEKGNGKHEIDLKIMGENLKLFRQTNNLTQTALAKFLNTSQSTICAYEKGKTILLTGFALQIVEKYSISLDWLCGRINK